MIQGIILAGGYSQRMGQNKMTLMWNGKYVIEHTISQMSKVVDEIIVVTGFYHEELFPVLKQYKNIKIVHNSDFKKGMFSSVKCGVREMSSDFFLVPGDYPLIEKDVYQLLLTGTKEIRVPVYNNRRGHPIYFQKHLIQPLLEFDDNLHLKAFRDLHDIEFMIYDSDSILFDIDTIADYQKLIERNDDFGSK